MNFLSILLIISITSIISWFLIKLIIPKLTILLIDKPNERSSHKKPIPKGAGLVIVLIITIFSTYSGNLIPLICCPLAIIGLIDDHHELSPIYRYGVQLATVFILSYSIQFKIINNNFSFLIFIAILISGTAIINFTNFMDGLDGLLAGCMVIIFSYASIKIDSSLWVLVGSLIGFLIWNWPPSKVFMGDIGSTFLGAMFVSLIMQSPTWKDALSFTLIATPLLGDACICIPRRLIAGHSIFRPHKLHLYQRLYQANWTQENVSILYISCTLLLAIGMVLGGLNTLLLICSIELLLGFYLDQKIAMPFVIASSNSSKNDL